MVRVGRRCHACGVAESAENVQAADTTIDQSYLWAQHHRTGRSVTPLRVGMESLFRRGASAARLARAGRMDASPVTGDPTQTLEAWHDGLSRMHSIGGKALACSEGGCKLQTMVVHQQSFTQRSAHDSLLRQLGLSSSLITSTTRTARCGPACRVVWQGTGQLDWPPLCRCLDAAN